MFAFLFFLLFLYMASYFKFIQVKFLSNKVPLQVKMLNGLEKVLQYLFQKSLIIEFYFFRWLKSDQIA